MPANALSIRDTPATPIPYVTPTDLVVFKINCCRLRWDDRKSRRDATDVVALLERYTTDSYALPVSQQQKDIMEAGLEDVVRYGGRTEQWFRQRLGM